MEGDILSISFNFGKRGLSEEQKALGKRMLAHLYWTKSASVKYIQAFSFTELGEICKFQDLNYSRGASVKSHAFQGIILFSRRFSQTKHHSHICQTQQNRIFCKNSEH